MDHETERAVLHELKMAIGGALAVITVWWLSVQVFALSFPMMHFVLIFFIISYLPILDTDAFPNHLPTSIYMWRALVNIVLFLCGLILIGPLGVILTASVPTGILPFLFSVISVTAILGLVRGTTFLLVIISHLTSSS